MKRTLICHTKRYKYDRTLWLTSYQHLFQLTAQYLWSHHQHTQHFKICNTRCKHQHTISKKLCLQHDLITNLRIYDTSPNDLHAQTHTRKNTIYKTHCQSHISMQRENKQQTKFHKMHFLIINQSHWHTHMQQKSHIIWTWAVCMQPLKWPDTWLN